MAPGTTSGPAIAIGHLKHAPGLAIGLLTALVKPDVIFAVLAGFTSICLMHAANHVIDLDIGGNPSDPYLIALQGVISGFGAWLRARQLRAPV